MVLEKVLMHDIPKERELFEFRKHPWVKVMPNELPRHISANPTVEAYELRWHSWVLSRVVSMSNSLSKLGMTLGNGRRTPCTYEEVSNR